MRFQGEFSLRSSPQGLAKATWGTGSDKFPVWSLRSRLPRCLQKSKISLGALEPVTPRIHLRFPEGFSFCATLVGLPKGMLGMIPSRLLRGLYLTLERWAVTPRLLERFQGEEPSLEAHLASWSDSHGLQGEI